MPSNPDSINIKVVQVDAPADQPFDEPINPLTDGFKVAALFVVETGEDNVEHAIWRDGDNLRFRDTANPGTSGGGKTLTELLSGSGGLTETQHKSLRQLIHFLHGPAEGFSGAYLESTPSADPFPTAAIWYEDNTKAKKVFEQTVNQNPFPTTETWKIYDTDGTTVLADAVDSITYSGPFESGRTRTVTVY